MTSTPILPAISPVPTTTPYDNNNEANVIKLKTQQQQHDNNHIKRNHVHSSTGSVATTSTDGKTGNKPGFDPGKGKSKNKSTWCHRIHLNSLWSVWYGFFGTFLQAYTAVKCTKRFLRYSILPWNNLTAIWELHGCLITTGLAVILLPLFLSCAVFKVGNQANDGYKLGRGGSGNRVLSPTTRRPCAALWRHGGPTAAFLHLTIALMFLLPRLVMEARLVQHGFLPADALWRTDIDFMVVHHDRLVVLSFMTAASSPHHHPPNVTTTPSSPAAHNHTPDAMALVTHHNSTSEVLEATLYRNLAQDIMKYLRTVFQMTDGDMHSLDSHIEQGFGSTVSVEFLNYVIALLVYSVRYPAVFWTTNKCFGIIFSVQLLANSIQSLLSFAGMSVLYKVQVIGAYKALPLLRHYPQGPSPLGSSETPFLLNPHVTLILFALSSFLVLSSSMILYLYGHARYNSFLSSFKDRSAHITSLGPSHSGWGYRTHGAALAALVASSVTYAPLLHDLTVVYRGSLDGAVIACIIGDITTLFLWVVVWLGLTIKYKWTFKITVTVGKAVVRSARSVKLVTDVELNKNSPNQVQPLLVVGNGRAYTVSETQNRKAIMSVVQKQQQTKPCEVVRTTQPNNDEENDEQIYWLRPQTASPQRSPDSITGGPLCWLTPSCGAKSRHNKKKHRVTFSEDNSTSQRSSSKGLDGTGAPGIRSADEDDGDYATLRELPLLPGARVHGPEDDSTSEEGKLLECVRDDNVTYASTSRDLIPPMDYEDPSPLLTPEPLADGTKKNNVVTVHNQLQTPRCLRRADSGMPPEELTPRSDSTTSSSCTPPDPPGSNHSETSSGVHSTASSVQGVSAPPVLAAAGRRATSVADLQHHPQQDIWKSCSLQRTTAPTPSSISVVSARASASSIYGVLGDACEVQTVVVKPGCSSSTPNQSDLYGYSKATKPEPEHGVPVILENTDTTVVIRRKATKPILDTLNIPVIKEEPFSRSTNMKMTSFTEHNDLKNIQASSATLPHYPTQPQPAAPYPHCSTMPLPQHSAPPPPGAGLAAGASCLVFPRQHTTLPTHHNGVRLFPTPAKRLQQYQPPNPH